MKTIFEVGSGGTSWRWSAALGLAVAMAVGTAARAWSAPEKAAAKKVAEKPGAAAKPAAGQVVVKLQPRQKVMGSVVMYYRPMRIVLSDKPAKKLVKEPEYLSKNPLYGTMQLGDAPDNQITVVVDETDQKQRIYIDRNGDLDLTNDGPAEWTRSNPNVLGPMEALIEVPHKGGKIPYTFHFYRFKTRLKDAVLYYRDAGREGEIPSNGKQYKVLVLDENADGRFDDLANGSIIIDLNQDVKLVGSPDSAEMHPLAEPFNIHGKVWEVASLSPDGTEMILRPSDAKVEMRAYLDPGYPAPAFAGKGLDDKPVALKEATAGAKYVLLDFWASWCGPCRYEYPNFRRLYARYKDHGLRIVGVNLDTQHEPAAKAAGDEMLEYPHVFDGLGWKSAVAVLYRVHAIPQTYLLDKDLKIVAKNLRGPALAKRLEELLGPGDEAAAKAVDAKATQRALSAAAEAIRKIEGIEQADVQVQSQGEGSDSRGTATVRVKPAQAKELDAKAQNAIRAVMIRTFLGLRPQDVTIVDLGKEKAAGPEKK